MKQEPAMECHMPLSENALDEMVARERERGAPPLTDWDSLSVRLKAEGLIREPVMSRFGSSRRWMQVAAGIALAAGGAAIGRRHHVLRVVDAIQPGGGAGDNGGSRYRGESEEKLGADAEFAS